ncbi:hypothetical protein GIB67_018765 [Kingdonia uniflora]|uniref:TPX2 C-terminal domain-containing protein n=1 Tax=Kingdonia uniflora TaxID=39325 RepID=A0A7J7NDK6_9MAGN|nr:hypothetical protein GIB67_018765 [Kingdonia uniflora]
MFSFIREIPCMYFQKQEEKLNIKEAQRMDFQAKSKEKADAEIKKLRQNLGFKAKPMPDFYRETETPKNQIKKLPLTRPISPKLGRKPSMISVPETCSLTPRRPSTKADTSNHSAENTSHTSSTQSVSSLPKTSSHENASPNIQS